MNAGASCSQLCLCPGGSANDRDNRWCDVLPLSPPTTLGADETPKTPAVGGTTPAGEQVEASGDSKTPEIASYANKRNALSLPCPRNDDQAFERPTVLAQFPAVWNSSSGRIHAFESCVMYASREFCQASAFNPIIAPHSLETRTLATIGVAYFLIKAVLMTAETPK